MRPSLIAIMILTLSVLAAQAQPTASFRAKADSTTLVMGDRVGVDLEVLKNTPDGELVGLPEKEQDYHGLELVDVACDTSALGNDRYQVNYHLVFQAFYPTDLLTLPPFTYVIGDDTLKSDILTFKVLPVELSPELGDINNIDSLTVHASEPPVRIKAKIYDYIPDWTIWVFLGLLAIAAAVALYMLYKKNGPALFTAKKPIPPYELAVQKLAALREKHLLEQGQVKTYYTDLIDILRSYLEGRFGINAMEMSSTQILRSIRDNKEIHLSADQIQQVLKLADIVKFAAANPTPDEGLRTFNTVSQFVESTKPEPVEEEADATQKQTKTNKNA